MINILISAIKIIFLLGFLIGIHETGHFLVAKKCKVRVNEFAIGFGPTIWKKQGKETKYVLRLIPLGGYVSMEGESERSEKEGSFTQASIPKRIAIVLAGAMVNIIFAIIVYFILASTVTNMSTIVDKTISNYGAESSGIESGDKIIKVAGKKVKTALDITEIMADSNGEEIIVTIERNGEEKNISIIPTEVKDDSTSSYYLGVQFKIAESNLKNNIYYATLNTGKFMTSVLDSLKQLFTGKVSTDQLMGPVGISEVVSKTSGLKEFIYMLALISMSLGVTNLIPFPPLDGGKILLLIIEGIRKKPIKEEVEMQIQLAGFAILIILSIYVTYHDVLRIL